MTVDDEKIYNEFFEAFIKIVKKYKMTHAETNYMLASLLYECIKMDLEKERCNI